MENTENTSQDVSQDDIDALELDFGDERTEPAQEPAPQEPAQPEPEVNPLEVLAKQYGDHMTPETVIKGYGEARNGLLKVSDEAARYKRQMEPWEEIAKAASENPQLLDRFRDAMSDSYDQSDPFAKTDPVAQKVQAMEDRLNEAQFGFELDNLNEQYGSIMDRADKAEMLFNAKMSRDYNATNHFWTKFGPSLLAKREQEAEQRGAQAVTRNLDKHVQMPSGSPEPPMTIDPNNMTEAEKDAVIEKILSGEMS